MSIPHTLDDVSLGGVGAASQSLTTRSPAARALYAAGGLSPATWFELEYRLRDDAACPCDCPSPCSVLRTWLNAEGPSVVRPGSRVVVVGSGLGDDVAELSSRGFDVTAFDVCLRAVELARARFPELASCFVQADVCDLPARLRRRFELVVDVQTLDSIPPGMRKEAAAGIASLVGAKGILLTIATARSTAESLDGVDGPPWPFTRDELCGMLLSAGLRPLREPDEFQDDASGSRWLRGIFGRCV
ncbi:MAG: class I SAM-dependent methyltransferase [Phycisphaerales bacterium]|nr:class I SAM-dependent methyltransferase [Phycisphaerales bacterium]